MTRSGRQPNDGNEPALLRVPRAQFSLELEAQREAGRQLRIREIASPAALKKAKDDYYSWDEYNTQLLRRRFTTSEIADDYAWWPGIATSPRSFEESVGEYHRDLEGKLRKLDSIRDQLPLYDDAPEVKPMPATEEPESTAIDAIFVVHGHDDALKLGVDSFLRQATTVEPIILHNEANRGRTLIEKFEATGARAGYAVVLFTADDVGAAKGKADELRPRARQNVVFEFGFFAGAIGRHRVAVIYEPDVELPSDLGGLVYIEHDRAGAWRAALLRELRAAGVDVDPNALI